MRSTLLALALISLPAVAQVAYDGKQYNGGGYGTARAAGVPGSSSVAVRPFTGVYGSSLLPRQEYWFSRTYPWATYTPYNRYFAYRGWRGGPGFDASGLRAYRGEQRLNNAIDNALRQEQSAVDDQQRVLGITRANLPATPNVDQPLAPPARESGEAQTATLRIAPFNAPSTQPVPEPGKLASKGPPARPSGLQQLTGTLSELRTIRYPNERGAHLIAQMESPDGWRFLADLGPVEQLTTLQPSRGMTVQVVGHEGQINGQRALFAQMVNAPDQSLSVRNNFPPAQPVAAPAEPEKTPRSPGEADQAK